MLVRRTATSALVLLALAGCSDEPTEDERRAELVDELAEDLVAEGDGALDADDARCVARRLADDVGAERFDEVVAAAEDPERADDLRDEVVDAFAACDALDPLLDGG